MVFARNGLLRQTLKLRSDPAIRFRIGEITSQIVQARSKFLPFAVTEVTHFERGCCSLAHCRAELIIVQLTTADSQHTKVSLNTTRASESKECGNKLALGEVARSPKYHDRARIDLRQLCFNWDRCPFDNYTQLF